METTAMTVVVGTFLLVLTAVMLLRGRLSVPFVFILFPIAAALILGFPLSDISKFAAEGMGKVTSTVAIMTFAIAYFGTLNDVGVFDVIVGKVMKQMGNRVELVLLLTCLVTAIAHLDCSGVTTCVVTIPLMLPFYKKMKINPCALILFLSLISGIMQSLPWSSAGMRLGAALGINAVDLWRTVVPLQIVGIVFTLALCFVLAKLEKKRGAGVSNEEFKALLTSVVNNSELKVRKSVFWFDIVFTVALIVVLLMGWLNPNLAFCVATVIALMVNYGTPKAQVKKIKEFGGNSIYMITIIFAIGIMAGITGGTGMIAAIANALLNVLPEGFHTVLLPIVSFISFPLTVVLGSDTVYAVIAPLLQGVTAPFGATALQVAQALIIGATVSANFSFCNPAPYLGLGLAGVEMRDHLKYSFLWGWAACILMSLVAVLLNLYAF